MMDRVFRGRPGRKQRRGRSSRALPRRVPGWRPRRAALGFSLAPVSLAGCRQPTAPGDPFLPFMRSRVPPPGTTAGGRAPIRITTAPLAKGRRPVGLRPSRSCRHRRRPSTSIRRGAVSMCRKARSSAEDDRQRRSTCQAERSTFSATSFARRAVSTRAGRPSPGQHAIGQCRFRWRRPLRMPTRRNQVEPVATRRCLKQPDISPRPGELDAATRRCRR